MKDERFDPEEVERLRVASVAFGKHEAEDQRLIALGRRVEALFSSGKSDPWWQFVERHDGESWSGEQTWEWFRSAIQGESRG
jgi:hypothetical protein